jgi:hypothetical protein
MSRSQRRERIDFLKLCQGWCIPDPPGLNRPLKRGCFWGFPHFELRKFNNLQAHFYKKRLFSAACKAPLLIASKRGPEGLLFHGSGHSNTGTAIKAGARMIATHSHSTEGVQFRKMHTWPDREAIYSQLRPFLSAMPDQILLGVELAGIKSIPPMLVG